MQAQARAACGVLAVEAQQRAQPGGCLKQRAWPSLTLAGARPALAGRGVVGQRRAPLLAAPPRAQPEVEELEASLAPSPVAAAAATGR